jgi:hypothetical protein
MQWYDLFPSYAQADQIRHQLWRDYSDEASEYDNGLVDTWSRSVDVMLVFVSFNILDV